MISTLFLKMAIKNIFLNRWRSFYTSVSIIAGTLGLALVSGYIERTKFNLELSAVYLEHKGHLAILRPEAVSHYLSAPKKLSLQAEDLEKIYAALKGQEKEVEFTSEYLTVPGLISNGQISVPIVAIGVEGAAFEKIYTHRRILENVPDWIVKSSHPPSDFLNPAAISLTKSIALEMQGQSPTPLTDLQLSGLTFRRDFNAVNVEVKGLHSTGNASLDKSLVFTNLKVLRELVDSPAVQYIAVFLKDTKAMQTVCDSLNEFFAKTSFDVRAVPYNDENWNAYYVGTLGFLYTLGLFCTVVVLVIIVLVNLATTLLAISERFRELGTLRALGFTPRSVQGLFALESLILTWCSSCLGFLLAIPVAQAVNSSHITYRPPGAAIDVQFVLDLDFGRAMAVGTLLSVLCFFAAFWLVGTTARKPIDQLLRDTGGSF